MPKRTSNRKRLESTDVQGEDSYVVLSLPTVASAKESKQIIEQQQAIVAIAQRAVIQIQEQADATDAAIKEAHRVFNAAKETLEDVARVEMAKHIIEWNWVDDDGEPLPQPHNNPSAFEQLTTSEMNWLSAQFQGIAAQKK